MGMKRRRKAFIQLPPRMAVKIIEFSLPSNLQDYLLGDLSEAFSERAKLGTNSARFWFWKQTFYAVLRLSYRGNLASLAVAINLLFFTLVSYVFLTLSGFSFQFQMQQNFVGLVILLPLFALPIINNFSVLRDVITYSNTRTQFLDEIELTRLSRFAGFVKRYCSWTAALLMMASASKLLGRVDVSSSSMPIDFLLGLELMLLIHASALHSIFSLLEVSGQQDAQLALT